MDVYGTFTFEEAKRLGVVPVLSGRGRMESGGEDTPEKTPDRQDGLSSAPG